MKYVFIGSFVATVLSSATAFAASQPKTVLNCESLSMGADQAALVEKWGDSYLLKEMTAGGDFLTREVSVPEFTSGVIELGRGYSPSYGKNLLTKSADGSWILTVQAGSMTSTEVTDCKSL